jgi:hypothetical protein
MLIHRASDSSSTTSDLYSGGVQFEARRDDYDDWKFSRSSSASKKNFGITLSCDWVTIDRFRTDNRIYWTIVQLVTTLHRSLSHTDYCSESRCLALASNGGRSSASGKTSSQGGDHLLSLSLMLRPTVSRPVCLGIEHPSAAYDQIFITVRRFRVCWCGALSLMRGRVCRLQ